MNNDKMPSPDRLRAATERLWAEYRRVGPRRSVSNPTRWQVRINSALLAMIYILFNMTCLILGVLFRTFG